MPSVSLPADALASGEDLTALIGVACRSSEARGRLLEECRAYLLLIANEELSPGVRAKASASDLVQDSFLEAQRDFDQFRGRSQRDLLVWLKGILLHNIADFHDRYRMTEMRSVDREISLQGSHNAAVPLESLQSSEHSPSSHVQLAEREQLVRNAIARLPSEYGRLILLRHYERLEFRVIAARMGRSTEAVRKLWRRAISRLEKELRNTL